jgi:hypothetical protein
VGFKEAGESNNNKNNSSDRRQLPSDLMQERSDGFDQHLPPDMRRAREKVKRETIASLKNALGAHSSIISNNDDFSVGSEDPQHESSGKSVKLFGKMQALPKGRYWGNSYAALDPSRPLSGQLSMQEKEVVIGMKGGLDELGLDQDDMLNTLADALMRAKVGERSMVSGAASPDGSTTSAGSYLDSIADSQFSAASGGYGMMTPGSSVLGDGLDEMSQSSLDLIEQYRGGNVAEDRPLLRSNTAEAAAAATGASGEEKKAEAEAEAEAEAALVFTAGGAQSAFTEPEAVTSAKKKQLTVDTSGSDAAPAAAPPSPELSPGRKAKKNRDASNPFLRKKASQKKIEETQANLQEMMTPKVELTSKARGALLNLGKFVQGHSNRKVMIAWTTIESRFQKSSHRKIETVKDANGFTHPVKYNALYLSALTGTLCSSQVRCSYKDLDALYKGFGMTDDDIFKSRRLAALRIVLGPTNGKGLRQEEELLEELRELMSEEEPLVTQEQVMDAVFPKDPRQRQKELDSLEAEKSAFIKRMLAEKAKKEELKQAAEMRMSKMITDFDRTRAEVQFPKGPMLFNRHKTLRELISFCEKVYEDYNAAADVQVSPENITMIGFDAYPECVKRGIREEEEKMRANQEAFKASLRKKAAAAGAAGAPGSTPSKQQPVPESKREDSPESVSSTTSSGFKKDGKNRDSSTPEKSNKAADNNSRRIGYDGAFRIPIHTTAVEGLKVLGLIRQIVTYGKGLNGISYRDVIELTQAYATTRLQARFRCFKRRWRYTAARRKWRQIFGVVKRIHFNAWSVFIRHVYDTRNYCWRKLVAWHVYAKNAKRRREHFRINFWPFYIWHRWAAASRSAKEKARFLAFRVEPTLRSMRVFRAWKGVYVDAKKLRDTADSFVMMMLKFHGGISLSWWRRWTRRRIKIRKRWYKYGIVTYKHKIFMRKVTPFLIWKMIWFYKKTLHQRITQLSPLFREFFVKAPPEDGVGEPQTRDIVRVPTNGEKKANAREAYEHMMEEMSVASSKSSAQSKKSKKSKKNKNKKKEEEERAAAAAENAGPKKFIRPFIFKPSANHNGNDIDSDGEEEDYVPAVMQNVYRDNMPELIAPTDVDFLGEADDFIFEKVFVLARRYAVVDNWNLVEWSLRYHKLIHRAFRNIRVFARVRKHARSSQYNHARIVKRRCFMAFLAWMLRDPSAINMAEQSEAEIVYADAKAHRMDKMMKWRDVAIEIKQKLARDEEDPLDADRELTEKEKRDRRTRRLEREAKAKADLEAGIMPFMAPNFLDWDREDRETEHSRAQKMLEISIKVRQQAVEMSEKADLKSAKFDTEEAEQKTTVKEVFALENEESEKALDNEFEYVDHFKVHAAGHMLEVLWKVYKEVQQFLLREERKKYFRILRMPMLERRARIMCNRKKMVNWIRICRRLASLSELAPIYNKRRTAWVFFNRWLKLVERESLDATPGLVPYLQRKLEIYPAFSNHLKAHGFVRTVYPNNKRLYAVCSELIAVFKRWTMFVSEEAVMRVMEKKAYRMYEIRLLQRCFTSIHSNMTPEETYQHRLDTKPYTLTRIEADLDQIRKRFISRRRRNLSISICRYNRKFTFYQMKAAKAAPSFRKFIVSHQISVARRMTREQRIMIEAFEARGTMEYRDVCCPALSDPVMPGMMRRLDGKVFRDPHPFDERDESFLEPPLPGGFRLSKVRINHQEFNGNVEASVTGWQMVWSADGMADIEGPKRGKWKGAAMSVHELVVPKHDFVMGLEYIYEGTSILGIRVKLFFAGFSRWLGGRPNMGSLSLYLGVENSPELDFEAEYSPPGRDEADNPAMPRNFVIGFTGVVHEQKVSGLALVVRKVRDQHIFSYTWVKDATNKRTAGGAGPVTEFNVRGDVSKEGQSGNEPSIAINTLPAVVDPGMANFQRGGVSVTESITIDASLPPIDAAEAAKAARKTEKAGRAGEDIDDMSSIGQGSLAIANVSAVETAAMSPKKDDETVMDPSSVMELLSSEEQFFDVLRMRTMETSTATGRAESFARRLWTSRALRADPQLSKLTGINIIAPLTRWLFQGICKRLVRGTPTEMEGEQLLEEGREAKAQEERHGRQALAAALKREEFRNTPQSWQGLRLLAPKDRAAKKLFNEQLRMYIAAVEDLRKKAADFREESTKLTKRGQKLLPRMQLSEYTCENIRMKVAAARHKETLLERMDMAAIKRALSGGDAKTSELSDVSMEMIRSSLSDVRPRSKGVLTLEDVIETEMAKTDKAPTRSTVSASTITVPSTPATTMGDNNNTTTAMFGKRTGSPGATRSSSDNGNSSSSSSSSKQKQQGKPMYMNTHAEQRVAVGASYRKISGINPPNHLSQTTAATAIHESETVGETRWVRKKSKGLIKLAHDKLLSKSTTDLRPLQLLKRGPGAADMGGGGMKEW